MSVESIKMMQINILHRFFVYILILVLFFSMIEANNGILGGIDLDDKLEIAKKVGSALVLALRSRKFMLPLPLVFPVPIPNYQPVIHDPWFWKLQAKSHLIHGLGGYGGVG
ncbi:uncharacterized protein LOC141849108 isoform X1 [Brevipalpus obovatus]|uniref:uncharacterized protein LOC141849108 isoform X1 n=1 Tax=Brevipalpus obovatus TaxID=246614 RepID=UPI003D9F6BAF